MSKGRRKRSPAFKATLALKAVKSEEMVVQLANRYEVHPGQVQTWKKALVEGASGVFGNGKEQKAKNDAALVARLYQEIGHRRSAAEGGAGSLGGEVRSRSPGLRRKMVDREHPKLPILQQCAPAFAGAGSAGR